MVIVSAVNEETRYSRKTLADRPKLDEWTSIEISQEQEGGKFIYKIVIGDKEIHSVENTNPVEMKSLKVYASDRWYPAQPGSIKALLIQTKLGEVFVLLLLEVFYCSAEKVVKKLNNRCKAAQL